LLLGNGVPLGYHGGHTFKCTKCRAQLGPFVIRTGRMERVQKGNAIVVETKDVAWSGKQPLIQVQELLDHRDKRS
jgi:hypothetical protein